MTLHPAYDDLDRKSEILSVSILHIEIEQRRCHCMTCYLLPFSVSVGRGFSFFVSGVFHLFCLPCHAFLPVHVFSVPFLRYFILNYDGPPE